MARGATFLNLILDGFDIQNLLLLVLSPTRFILLPSHGPLDGSPRGPLRPPFFTATAGFRKLGPVDRFKGMAGLNFFWTGLIFGFLACPRGTTRVFVLGALPEPVVSDCCSDILGRRRTTLSLNDPALPRLTTDPVGLSSLENILVSIVDKTASLEPLALRFIDRSVGQGEGSPGAISNAIKAGGESGPGAVKTLPGVVGVELLSR